MTKLSEPDDDQPASILRVVDGIATLGIIAMGIGIVLFTGRRGSSGTTSSLDLRARVSVATNSELFKRPERPRLETVGKAPVNLNLENEVAPGTLRQVNEITRIGGNRSDNEIRADETPYLCSPHAMLSLPV